MSNQIIQKSDNILKLKDLLDKFDMGMSFRSETIDKDKIIELVHEHTDKIFLQDNCETKVKNYERLVYQLTKLIEN
jgi:hypothetical protein